MSFFGFCLKIAVVNPAGPVPISNISNLIFIIFGVIGFVGYFLWFWFEKCSVYYLKRQDPMEDPSYVLST